MFDIGWSELLVIAVVLIVVVGPKDLPPMLRAFGKMTANLRKMAGEFRTQFDEALRESELDKTISDARGLNPTNALRDAINPLRQMGQDIRDDLNKATQVHNPGAAQAGLTQTDIEAQHAVEGTPPAGPAPEIPTNFPSPPSAPVAQPPLATPSAPSVVPATAPATVNPAQPAPATAPAVSEPAAAPKKAPRKSAAKAKAAAEPAPPAETVAEKPKRSRAAKPTVAEPNLVAEAAAAAVEAAEQAPAKPAPRKRAAKKTEVPKDDA